MKARELVKLGFDEGPVVGAVLRGCESATAAGLNAWEVRERVRALRDDPRAFLEDAHFKEAAAIVCLVGVTDEYSFRDNDAAQGDIWIELQIDAGAIAQMTNAMRLPISVAGALMPDAHIGHGLPIGGVLATEGAAMPSRVNASSYFRTSMLSLGGGWIGGRMYCEVAGLETMAPIE